MELIDRHALLKKVYENTQERERMTDGEWCRKCIYEAPKVDAEPVRHGRWIEGTSRGSYSIYCSYCGSHKETICPSDYCPDCGEEMDATVTNDGKGDADNG